jgi:hypothetical protein
MINVHQDMVKVYVKTVNISKDIVYCMLKVNMDIVNVPQGMVNVFMNMLI